MVGGTFNDGNYKMPTECQAQWYIDLANKTPQVIGLDWFLYGDFPGISGVRNDPSGIVNYLRDQGKKILLTANPVVANPAYLNTKVFIPPAPVTCTYKLEQTTQNFQLAGGNGGFSMSTKDGCTWSAVSNDSWITVIGITSGSGRGTISYSVTPNTGTAWNGTITSRGQTFNVTQDGAQSGPTPAPPPAPLPVPIPWLNPALCVTPDPFMGNGACLNGTWVYAPWSDPLPATPTLQITPTPIPDESPTSCPTDKFLSLDGGGCVDNYDGKNVDLAPIYTTTTPTQEPAPTPTPAPIPEPAPALIPEPTPEPDPAPTPEPDPKPSTDNSPDDNADLLAS